MEINIRSYFKGKYWQLIHPLHVKLSFQGRPDLRCKGVLICDSEIKCGLDPASHKPATSCGYFNFSRASISQRWCQTGL